MSPELELSSARQLHECLICFLAHFVGKCKSRESCLDLSMGARIPEVESEMTP